MKTANILEISQLNTWFMNGDNPVKAVADADLILHKGEVLGIVGESGCGKSTLAKSVIGLIDPPGRIVSGHIIYQGRDLPAVSEDEYRRLRGSHISYMIQNPMSSFNPVFSIIDQLTNAVRLHQPLSRGQARGAALELLASVKITDPQVFGQAYPHQLSGGMLQRAAIALSIAGQPHILLADEPTTALDVSSQAEILALLDDLNQRRQMSMLIITHNFGVIWEVCRRVMVMYAGRIVEEASAVDIYRHPRHPYTRALLKSVLTMQNRRQDLLPYLPGRVNNETGVGCEFAPRCTLARERCYQERPDKKQVTDSHFVCCHYLGGEGSN